MQLAKVLYCLVKLLKQQRKLPISDTVRAGEASGLSFIIAITYIFTNCCAARTRCTILYYYLIHVHNQQATRVSFTFGAELPV